MEKHIQMVRVQRNVVLQNISKPFLWLNEKYRLATQYLKEAQRLYISNFFKSFCKFVKR